MSRRPSRYTRQRPQLRDFVCPVCGAVITIPKHRGQTSPGHIKTMYCYRCKAITDHIQRE